MKRRKRICYSEADKALMWDRWQAGESLHASARLFDRHHPSIQGGGWPGLTGYARRCANDPDWH